MYTEFYNLKEKPFNLTPSSRFLYLGDIHKEALALLSYGISERKGFVLLTGEVGTGKTTMINALIQNLDNRTEYVYLSNPLLSAKDFIKYIAQITLKKNMRSKTRGEVLLELEDFLKEYLKDQRNFILIVDEAQKLSFELLEEIRLLSNMETGDEKLINIFLVGQPEFNKILSEPRCKPLLQRISIKYHIKPLDEKESHQYIITRLKKAGAEDAYKIFPKEVIKSIHKYSEGYPRMINVVADNALLLGYSRGKRQITRRMIEESYKDIRLEITTDRKSRQTEKAPLSDNEVISEPLVYYWKWAAGVIVIVIFALMMGITAFFLKSQQQKIDLEIKDIKDDIKMFQMNMEQYQKEMMDFLKNSREEGERNNQEDG